MSKKVKYSTEVLKGVIHKYYKDKNYIGTKLSFSTLAKYASDVLNYEDIKYYHFSRNEEINKMINDYNTSLEKAIVSYTEDDSQFTTLDVKEFVKINCGNRQELIFCLTKLQESLKNIYDKKVEVDIENKKLKSEIEKLNNQKETYRIKNIELTENLKKIKDEKNALISRLNLEEERQLISALNSTGLHSIDVEGETKIQEDIEKLTDDNGKDLKSLMNKFSNIFDKK